METINDLFQTLLTKEFNSLIRERGKQYNKLILELAPLGLSQSSVHIKQALEVQTNIMRHFINYAIKEFKRMCNSVESNTKELEITYRANIDSVYNLSLNTMQDVIKSASTRPQDRYEEYIKVELEKVKMEALEELRIAKTEKKFGLEKTVPPAITIKDSAINVLNLGNIIGNIERNITALKNSGHTDTAEIIRALKDKIDRFKDDLGEKYLEILSHLEFLTEETNKQQEKRNIAVIKSVFLYISQTVSTISGLANIWDKYGQQIAAFLRLDIGK